MTSNIINQRKILEPVNFGLCITAQDYFRAAMSLKQSNIGGKPYYVLLSLSIECYLKSIKTTVTYQGSIGVNVSHIRLKSHNLNQLFRAVKEAPPDEANYLEKQYQVKFSTSFFEDIASIAEVFDKQRYPYPKSGNVPSPKFPNNPLKRVKNDNSIEVNITALENIAAFLFQTVQFDGLH